MVMMGSISPMTQFPQEVSGAWKLEQLGSSRAVIGRVQIASYYPHNDMLLRTNKSIGFTKGQGERMRNEFRNSSPAFSFKTSLKLATLRAFAARKSVRAN